MWYTVEISVAGTLTSSE
ncbi:unnamed protein product, partial [Adineta steineri]